MDMRQSLFAAAIIVSVIGLSSFVVSFL